jgi:hypothetical protein
MNFISYLNMHRSRLGYVNCVLLISDVQLDSLTALKRRFEELIFAPVFENSPDFPDFISLLRQGAIEEIDRQVEKRSFRRSKRRRQDVLPETALRGPRAYNVGDLWLYQASMRSHVGRIPRDYSGEPIELAKELGLLSPGYALTEFGHMLSLFLRERVGEAVRPRAEPNPLQIYDDIALRLFYLYALVRSDVVFPAMLGALAQGEPLKTEHALTNALDELTKRIEAEGRLDAITEAQGLFKLRARIRKPRPSGQQSTELPVDKAQRVPRLEFAVDLGFLDRKDDSGTDRGGYCSTGALARVPIAFRALLERPSTTYQWLDRQFFAAAGMLYDRPLRKCDSVDERLLYFVKGGSFLKRKVGFVPGRVAAIIGCMYAWVDGVRLEIADLFDEVYRVPKGPWAGSIQFSGGSRLDSEFLVIIDAELEGRLRGAVANRR